jgi:hypothetical protein
MAPTEVLRFAQNDGFVFRRFWVADDASAFGVKGTATLGMAYFYGSKLAGVTLPTILGSFGRVFLGDWEFSTVLGA